MVGCNTTTTKRVAASVLCVRCLPQRFSRVFTPVCVRWSVGYVCVFEEARIYTYIKGGPEEACNQANCKVVFVVISSSLV